MVGVTHLSDLAYGVGKILLEEGIFSVQATPLRQNLCLLEESVEGDLELLLSDGGDWKNKWFKEVRGWLPFEVECSIVVNISIYGIPCFVRNMAFIEMWPQI